MPYIFYLTFIYLNLIVFYYFIYLKNLNNNILFSSFLNYIFLITLFIYYIYFKDFSYSLIFSILLLFASLSLNIKIKKELHSIKIPFLIYYFLTCIIFSFSLLSLF